MTRSSETNPVLRLFTQASGGLAGLLLSGLAVVGVGLALAGCAVAKHEHKARGFAFEGHELTVDASEGEVKLVPGPAGRVTVDGDFSGSATGEGHATVSFHDGTLHLAVVCSGVTFNCKGGYVVHVPAGVDLDLNASGSPVSAHGLEGAVKASLTADATIDLTEPGGDLDLATAGGGITVNRARSPRVDVRGELDGAAAVRFADPPEAVKVRTEDGYADVDLPAGEDTYRLAHPVAGNVESDPGSSRTVDVSSASGDARVTKAG
jgi:hypothetical protein